MFNIAPLIEGADLDNPRICRYTAGGLRNGVPSYIQVAHRFFWGGLASPSRSDYPPHPDAHARPGERYFTYRLVPSERVAGQVRQVTLLNLGRHFAVGQAHWPGLCARVEELLSGQASLLGGADSLLVERERNGSLQRCWRAKGSAVLSRRCRNPCWW